MSSPVVPPVAAAAPVAPEDPDHPTTAEGKIALGQRVYERKGCNSCHSVDGSARVGPSWRGIWGQPVKLADATVRTVDAAYVEESILHPQAAIVAGYPPAMPSFEAQLRPDELAGVIAYIASLADRAAPP